MNLRSRCFVQPSLIAKSFATGASIRRCNVVRRRPRYRFSRIAACQPSSTASSIPVPDPRSSYSLQEEDLSTLETFRVADYEVGKRLDKLISERFNEKSRTYIQSLLSSSCVSVDDVVVNAKSAKLVADQLVTIRFLPTQRDLPLTPEPVPLDIAYEDSDLVVVNKPAGMVVHPAPGNWTGTLVHALCHRYPDIADQGGARPGIVHRLDKGTSGLIVVARSREVASSIASQFSQRQVFKEYIAITIGNPAGKGCVGRSINAAIGRCPVDRLRMAVVDGNAGGRPAYSTVHTLAHDDAGLLHAVRVHIGSGRTHQIRVHLRHVRAPVLGDDIYGARDVNRRFASSATRPMLHARRLTFDHPVTGVKLDIKAPLAEDMQNLLSRVVYPNFKAETDW